MMQILRKVLMDQKYETEEKFRKTEFVEREFLENFKEFINSNLIKVTTGARRSGKSFFTYSLLKNENFGYVNFDEPMLKNVNSNDIFSALLEIYGKNMNIIFFDEIQNMQAWELFVNKLHRSGYNLFITGSNAKLLSKELSTHLTGRHIQMEIFPFSFREYLQALKFKEPIETTAGQGLVKNHLLNYLENGGFPEIVVEKENPRIYLRQLFNDIVEKDIIMRYNIAYKKTFIEIANTLIDNFGNYVTSNSIKNSFGLKSVHTAKNYLYYLNESYLVYFINKLSFKPKEKEVAPKKIYVTDPGLINVVSMKFKEDFGRIIENVVAIDLLRRRSYWHKTWEIYYYKDYQDHEVDFAIKDGMRIKYLIQVTYSSGKDEIEKRELNSLIKASNELKCDNLTVITWDYEDEWNIENKKIRFIPLWKWLIEIRS